MGEAVGVLIILVFLVLGMGWLIPTEANIVIWLYMLINIFYNFGLKDNAVLGIFSIAFGFILRTLAGTIGLGLDTSVWLVVTILALALFLATTKRLQEMRTSSAKHKKVLEKYTENYLLATAIISATITIVFFTLYAITEHNEMLYIIAVLLVIMGFFRYLHIVLVKEEGDDPIRTFMTDYQLLLIFALWAAVQVATLYGPKIFRIIW